MRRFFLLLLASIVALNASSQINQVSYYLIAHPDDWQLFMGVYAHNDITNKNGKVVFIQITSGTPDGTLGWAAMSTSKPLYLAREDGHMSSIRLAADGSFDNGNNRIPWFPNDLTVADQTFTNVSSTSVCGFTQQRTHVITRIQYRNTITYFLRLPDNSNSQGNLQLLRNASCSSPVSLASVDGKSTYNSWQDLVKTVRAITLFEAGSITNTFLNVHDLDTSTSMNPGDNPDHLDAARTVLDDPTNIMATKTLFQGYVTGYSSGTYARPTNLAPRDIIKEAGLYAAYCTSKVLAGRPSDWIPDVPLPGHDYPDNDWTSKCYARDSRSPSYRSAITGSPIVAPVTAGNSTKPVISLFPNPAESSFSIYSSKLGKVRVNILNLYGAAVPGFKPQYMELAEGVNLVQLNRKDMSPGTYFVQITSDIKTLNLTQTLVIE